MADYSVETVTLGPPKPRYYVVRRGVEVAALYVNNLPADAVGKVFLHFGDDGPGIPLRYNAQSYLRTPPQRDGVWLSWSVDLLGIELELVVGTIVARAG